MIRTVWAHTRTGMQVRAGMRTWKVERTGKYPDLIDLATGERVAGEGLCSLGSEVWVLEPGDELYRRHPTEEYFDRLSDCASRKVAKALIALHFQEPEIVYVADRKVAWRASTADPFTCPGPVDLLHLYLFHHDVPTFRAGLSTGEIVGMHSRSPESITHDHDHDHEDQGGVRR